MPALPAGTYRAIPRTSTLYLVLPLLLLLLLLLLPLLPVLFNVKIASRQILYCQFTPFCPDTKESLNNNV